MSSIISPRAIANKTRNVVRWAALAPSTDSQATPLAYLEKLNPEQRRAVEHGAREKEFAPAAPLLVIAGAGSGKTNTLAHRVAHLIVNGADPRRILLMTFSPSGGGRDDAPRRAHPRAGDGNQRRAHDRRRSPTAEKVVRGREFLITSLLILVGLATAGLLSAPMEQRFFGGDLVRWMSSTLGVVYVQRNSILIAFGVGFMVIP